MATKTNKRRFYLVTILIKPAGYNKIVLEGLFIAPEGGATIPSIKKQCWSFIAPQIPLEKYGIDPAQAQEDIKVKSLAVDFILNIAEEEDKK